jgi:CheY-like chemotaxis protein
MLAVRASELQSRVTTVSAIEATNRSEISALDARPVLLVDGDFDSRMICRTTLARAGIEVVTVSDSASCLGVARIVQPKVIILDVESEDDGLQFLANVRDDSNLLDATMIALTDHGAANHERTLAAAGFDRVLTKPIEPTAVVAAVQQGMSQPNRKG